MAAATMARAATTLYSTPVNRLTILLQTNQELVRQNRLDVPYKGVVDAFKRTYKNEGLLSFYRGNTIQILRAGASPALSFAFKDTFRHMFKPDRIKDGYGLWFAKGLLSGAAAGATSMLFLYPLDLGFVKRTTDVLSPASGMTRKHGGIFSIWKDVVKHDGVTGLYRGFGISVAGIMIYRGLYFGLYDALKPVLVTDPKNFVASFALGWAVTLSASLGSYPVTLLRNRLMVTTGGGLTYKHTLHLAREIMAKEGLRGFFRGYLFTTTMTLASAGMLAGYDVVKSSLNKQQQQ